MNKSASPEARVLRLVRTIDGARRERKYLRYLNTTGTISITNALQVAFPELSLSDAADTVAYWLRNVSNP
jgi:hypothetical protein